MRAGSHSRLRVATALALLAGAGCVTAQKQSREAAARWLHCPQEQLELVAADVYRGCDAEVFCVAGTCRSNLTWQQRFAAVAERFSGQFGCQPAATHVTERERDYVVEGCGRHALCALGADCTEFFELPAMLARARAAYSREMGCPAAEVSVAYLRDGFRALGCNRAATCVTVDGPCMSITVPPCSEIAEQRYDECRAAQKGEDPGECRARYEQALGGCAAGGGTR